MEGWNLSLLHSTTPLFVLLVILLVWFVAIVVVHVWFPFWAKQPILHSYDFWRRIYLHRPLVLQTDAAALTRSQQKQMWFRPNEVHTWMMSDLPEPVLDAVLEALQGMGSTESMLWAVPKRVWVQCYAGGSAASFVSLFREPGSAFVDGVVASRCLRMRLWSIATPVYYIDPLSVRDGGKAQTVSCALFQTHEFRQRRVSASSRSEPIPVSVFRKQGAPIAGIVPVMEHRVIELLAPRFAEGMPRLQLPAPFRLRRTDGIASLYGLFETGVGTDWMLFPERGSMESRLDLTVYAILQKDAWAGFFVLRRTWEVDAETGGEAVELAASWHDPNLPVRQFQIAFLAALQDLSQTVSMNRLRIPYRGVNGEVVGGGAPEVGEWTEYWYVYNMISPGVAAVRALILV